MPSTVAGVALGLAFLVLAASLPRVSLVGLFIGLSATGAAILAWSVPDLPGLVWTVYGAQIVVLAAWTIPWSRHARVLTRLGTAWTGMSYWALGAVGAAVTALVQADGRFLVVSGQRLAYLALATFTVLAVVKAARAPDTSVTIGLAAAFLVTLGVLFLAGASSVFERVHDVPDHAAASFLENRFWGGSGVFYHPVSMGGLAVCVGMRLALDRTLAPWQRVAAVALVPLVIVLTQARTAALLALAAAILAVVLHYRDRRTEGDRRWLPSRPSHAVAALVAVSLLVGGTVVYHRGVVDFFTVARYRDSPVAQSLGEAGDITSGRLETWRQVIREFRSDGWSEKLLGSAEHSRAVVVRRGDRTDDRVHVLIDNAALGALRRGGTAGAVAFVAGVVLLVVHAVRGGPRWLTVAALAGLVTIPTTEWLLGSPLWLLLLGGEAAAGGGGDRQS